VKKNLIVAKNKENRFSKNIFLLKIYRKGGKKRPEGKKKVTL